MRGLESAGGGAQTGEADREVGFPAGAEEIIKMGGEGDGLFAPIPQSEKHPDADASETGGVPAFRASQPPIVILFRSGNVYPGVGRAVVSFLINDKSFRHGSDERKVIGSFQRGDFDRELVDFRG